MASTNKTTNYELSQYVGSDKPTYLGDYNGDMLKIDTAIHTNAGAIATAQSTADTASTTANTALTNAGTAQTTADNANTTATSALSKATSNETKITALETANTYSTTEEIPCGTWIDGKPLYRKVFEDTSLAFNVITTVLHNISNVDFIHVVGADYCSTSSHTSRSINAFKTESDYFAQANRNSYAYYLKQISTFDKLIVTLEYTKTTD